jgi:adenosylcobinamide-phosphate synthase
MTLSDMSNVLVLLLALVIDQVVGEPPNPVHPVVWIGKLIALLTRWGGGRSRVVQFLYGIIVSLFVIGVFSVSVYFGLRYLKDFSLLAYIIVGALVFKTTFSLRGLRRAALRVKACLVQDKLPEARFEVRALVGRQTAQLESGQLVSATVESVAENACDSFVAPLFFFLFLGVPGAIAYRAVNTLDNMIGFRGKYEYLGKFAARLDDVVNFIPARITALVIVLASWVCRKDAAGSWRIMWRDRNKTLGPNGGWTMAAMAGALDTQLEKVGYYRLGDITSNSPPLSSRTIDASLVILMILALAWTLVVVLAQVVYYAAT